MLLLALSAHASPIDGLVQFAGSAYVAEGQELFRSTDGQTWLRVTPVENGLPVPVNDVAASPDALFVTTGAAVFRSTDGNVWERRVDVVPDGEYLWVHLEANAQQLSLEAASGEEFRVSVDGGRTWRAAEASEVLSHKQQLEGRLDLDAERAYYLGEKQVRAKTGNAVLAQFTEPPVAVGAAGSNLAWWGRDDALVVRRGATELRTTVEALELEMPEVLTLVEFGKDLVIGGAVGLWRLDANGQFVQVFPLEGLGAPTAWAPRAVVPTGEKIVPWDGAAMTISIPAGWRAFEYGPFSLFRPMMYGVMAAVTVERSPGKRCAEVRSVPEGGDWEYVAFPPGMPSAWSASPVVQRDKLPNWELCVDRPADAWTVKISGADPATDAELASVLANLAAGMELAAASEDSVAKLPATEDADIGIAAALGIEPQYALGDPGAFHGLAVRLNASMLGDSEDWFNMHLDAALGATTDSLGFLYDAGLGLGFGHRITPGFSAGVYSGIGLDGSAPVEPFALRAPMGAVFLVSPGGPVAFALRTEARWWFATTREPSSGFLGFDATRTTLDMALGGKSDPGEGLGASGFVLGLVWEQQDQAHQVGVRIGLGGVNNAN
jgi:hypothetical protein